MQGAMSDPTSKQSAGQRPSKPVKPSREDRLKAALKANMARRKAQARARKATGSADTDKED